MITNELAPNPLVISTTIACMYYPRPPGTRGFGPLKELPPYPVLCLSINHEMFLGRALQKTSVPIHLNISPHPMQLLMTTSPATDRRPWTPIPW